MRLSALLLLFALILSACSRPLAPGERAFANDIFGRGLNVDQTRIAAGFGLSAPPNTTAAPLASGKLKTLPGICDRVPQGPRTEPPPAFALWNRIHISDEFYRGETAPGWPNQVLLPQSLIMAHELVHVWQWQNRAVTGYRPARAALESLLNLDPYFYQPGDPTGFLSFSYEQQAALVEDYVCYALLDPINPRREDLRTILVPYFPLDRLDAALAR
jgi:hypothetical protein